VITLTISTIQNSKQKKVFKKKGKIHNSLECSEQVAKMLSTDYTNHVYTKDTHT